MTDLISDNDPLKEKLLETVHRRFIEILRKDDDGSIATTYGDSQDTLVSSASADDKRYGFLLTLHEDLKHADDDDDDDNNNDDNDENEPKAKKLRTAATGQSYSVECSQPKKSPTSDGKTCLDIANFILDECTNDELNSFRVITCALPLLKGSDHSREELKTKLSQINTDNIDVIIFNRQVYAKDDDLNQRFLDLERMFNPCGVASIRHMLSEVFSSKTERKTTKQEEETTKSKREEQNALELDWNKDYVAASNTDSIDFIADLTKGYAYVVSGESGAGKTWFAKKWLPHKFKKASFIYHSLDDMDKIQFEKSKNPQLGKLCQDAMKYLKFHHDGDPQPVYEAISELSRRNNESRNKAAFSKFNDLVQKSFHGYNDLEEWWNKSWTSTDANSVTQEPLEQLIIVIDEMGKDTHLARGIVDEVRKIYTRIFNHGVAKQPLIFLVGSGLDVFIESDKLDFHTRSKGDYEYLVANEAFGTDPSKSTVVTLRGPDLENNTEIGGMSVEAIKKGTYSRILATNTRMLTRGVIPVLTNSFHKISVRDEDIERRREELGSTNIVMDYAARIYIQLNCLKRFYDKGRYDLDSILLKQFRVLCFAESTNIAKAYKDENDVEYPVLPQSKMFTLYPSQDNLDFFMDYVQMLRFGLVASTITETSPALRYLACEGQTASMNAQDGFAFEIILRHHLVRRHKVMYGLERKEKNAHKDYLCTQYDLVQAWPPSVTRNNNDHKDLDAVQKEVQARYESEASTDRPHDDIKRILSLVEHYSNWDVVLRQTVGNVQGANVMVLSKRKDTDTVSIDLYQGKHKRKVPGPKSKFMKDAFASLGVQYEVDSEENYKFNTNPEAGSAGFTRKGLQVFLSKLSSELRAEVQIRHRIVVFSTKWELFDDQTWKQEESQKLLKAASEEKVWVWPGDMLEPTISALVPVPLQDFEDVEGG